MPTVLMLLSQLFDVANRLADLQVPDWHRRFQMHCGSGDESFEENMRCWSRSAASGASMREICVEAKRPTQKLKSL